MSLPKTADHHWRMMYFANRVGDHGISLAQYLLDPDAILHAVIYGTARPLPEGEEFYPLLPAQQAIADRLEAEELAETLQEEMDGQHSRQGNVIEMHGPRQIEPMNRHYRTKKWKCGTGGIANAK